ncbi:MAG: MBL fold metallo-hydrolase [Rhodobacteraceae bacterium]|nr:MBL fold metallo-hydrolase [Paracoccaceae bacterium]
MTLAQKLQQRLAHRRLDSGARAKHPLLVRLSPLTAAAALAFLGLAACAANPFANEPVVDQAAPTAFNSELEYLKALNDAGPPQDLQVIVLLMQEYQTSNRRAEGVALFTELLAKHEGELTPPQELVYLASLGVLRAETASQVPLYNRIGWVEETIEMLEKARSIGGEDAFYPRFTSGLVYSQLPESFGKAEQGRADLEWLVENRAQAPQPGLMRTVYAALARSYLTEGRTQDAAPLLALAAGEGSLTTNFSVGPEIGGAFHPPRFSAIEPEKVYLVTGAEFTEYYFIVSDDGRQLISIDAGTTPAFAKRAYDIFKQNVPDAPPLTTVFITHAHWDHIGGHRFFRELNPDVKFYGRSNYKEEIALMAAGPETPAAWFFGSGFDFNQVTKYRPDIEINKPRDVTIGGTRFELLPAPGSETPDAMYIHMPDNGLLFVGDFIMPFIGAPFVEEGDLNALIEAIDMIADLQPRQLLHGHEPLTANWPTPERLLQMQPHLVWLRDETLKRVRAGASRSDIHHANLIPPTLYEDPQSQILFLVMREQVINRLYDQSVGYWEADLTGLDHLGPSEYGEALSRYFDLDEQQISEALEAMIAAGDYHLAERITRWALASQPDSDRLKGLQRRAALGLRRKYQAYNPFKFMLYSELANAPAAQLPAVDAAITQE